MTTLAELRNGVYKSNMGVVGIEIETESKQAYSLNSMKYWGAHGDGSLRHNGVEFILKRPLTPGTKDYDDALNEFKDVTKDIKFIGDSAYTSVHVHFNMVDRELKHLANFIVLYLLFENVLNRYCGPDRNGNLFCLKTQCAEDLHLLYVQLFKAIENRKAYHFIRSLNENQYKYSALNIVPLKNLGSVEIRTHPGTTDVKVVNKWVSMLTRLYTLAQKYKDPREILSLLKGKDNYHGLVKYVFLNYSTEFNQEKLDEDIKDNLYYVKTLVDSVKDWDKFGETKTNLSFHFTSYIDENSNTPTQTFTLAEDF